MVDMGQVNKDLYYVDIYMFGTPKTASVYLLLGEGITIIETGVPSSAEIILSGIEELGHKKEDIQNIIVTQIHLDHAGGAGVLIKELPWAKLYVHPEGVPHLIDPSKLIKSTERAMGELFRYFSGIIPVPRENVCPVTDERISIGNDKVLRIFATPGHAPHHLSIYEEKNKYLFSGEALGSYYPDFDLLFPAVAPPAFHFDQSIASIARIKNLDIHTILFSQFGPYDQVEKALEESGKKLIELKENMETKLNQGKEPPEMIKELSEEYPAIKNNFPPSFVDFTFNGLVYGFLLYFKNRNS
jgi:glyoxylase-like metal-dependent hydrolase (beta-lactamase superfamily II)